MRRLPHWHSIVVALSLAAGLGSVLGNLVLLDAPLFQTFTSGQSFAVTWLLVGAVTGGYLWGRATGEKKPARDRTYA